MEKVFNRIQDSWQYRPGREKQSFQTIDLHTGGEPLRVIYSGIPKLSNGSILDYRDYLRKHHDDLRQLLMYEPRGHYDMYGCILTPPVQRETDFGVIFLHNAGYSTMCGHAVIALTRLAVELDWKELRAGKLDLVMEAPCGQIRSHYDAHADGFPISFAGVPSFVCATGQKIDIPQVGTVLFDIAYGGAFYAFVNADGLDLSLGKENVNALIAVAKVLKAKIVEKHRDQIKHPFDDRLSFLYGIIFTSDTQCSEGVDSRNVCVFADGEVDRCPTGSGASARAAIWNHKGLTNRGESRIIESITGSKFRVRTLKETTFGSHRAVIPQVEGNAFITGAHTFYLDPEDDFPHGFLLR